MKHVAERNKPYLESNLEMEQSAGDLVDVDGD